MLKIQHYKNLFLTQPLGCVDIPKFIEEVRTFNPEAAIASLKSSDKEAYQKKKAELPCASFNFIFNGKRRNKNIVRSTGLLYFDIDNADFDINFIPKDMIHAYWRSLSGKGYSILVRVKGVTAENFKAQYTEATKILGISEVYDKRARKKTQGCVIPNDLSAYYNKNSSIIDLSSITTINSITTVKSYNKSINSNNKKKIKNKKVLLEVTKKNFLVRSRDAHGKRRIWFDNRHHFDLKDEESIRIYTKDSPLVSVNMMGYCEGNRNHTVSIALTNAAWLNMNVSVLDIAKVIHKYMDNKECDNLPEDEFQAIVDKVALRKHTKTLDPVPTDVEFFTVTREGVCKKKARGQHEQGISMVKIAEALDTLQEEGRNITQTLVAQEAGLSRKTVSKYWKVFVEQVKSVKASETITKEVVDVITCQEKLPEARIIAYTVDGYIPVFVEEVDKVNKAVGDTEIFKIPF